MRRTRRLRKAPEGAEEDSSTNLEPRKSPEGVEDPDEMSNAHDVIVGMEVKKVTLISIPLVFFPSTLVNSTSSNEFSMNET